MTTQRDATLRRAALLLAAGSAAAILFSVAVSQILLVASLLTILVARIPLRMPPIRLPLALFFFGTVVALLLSPDPRAGFSQVKKFFVYLGLVSIYSTFSGTADARRLVLAWGALATASGLWSFVQFSLKMRAGIAEGADLYLHYVASRTTGFMSHWMTFSAELMVAGLMLTALLLFARERRAWWAAVAVIGAALVLAWTRSVWFGAAVGAVYLVAVWRPRLLLVAPLLLAAGFAVAPPMLRDRVTSIWKPRGTVDSNDHRRVTFRTGVEMIKAHPWFGLGPEIVGRDFLKYVPPDIPRPLPEGFYGHLHNFYLQYAADRGIPTLIALLWMLTRILTDFVRAARTSEGVPRALLHGAVAAILGLLVEGVFEHNINDTEVLTMFVTTIAVGYLAVHAQRQAAHA